MTKTNVKYILTFAFIAIGSLSKAQQPKVVIDTAANTVAIDSNSIVIENEVQERGFWLELLAKDTTFIGYFKSKGKATEPFTIFISQIQKARFLPFTFEFRIFMRPSVFDKERLGQQLSDLGYINYNVMLAPTQQKSFDIIRVEQVGIEI